MDKIIEFADERQKAWCIHCGGWIGSLVTNWDHVPSKGLLLKPYPKNLPKVQVCTPCNQSFSPDEEYMIAFLNCVIVGSTDPEDQKNPRIKRILRNKSKLRTRIESAKMEQKTFDGGMQAVWCPESDRINRVILKNARGHAFYEYGEPMLEEPEHVRSSPLHTLTADQRADFELIDSGGLWPEVGSRMMKRAITGQDLSGDWVIVQEGTYRYALAQQGVMLVRTVLYEYLATEVYWGD